MNALAPVLPEPLRSIRARARAAFSIIELMVAVALLGVVMFALYALFDQTQKALRVAAGQVDINEPVRAALDLLTSDLQRAAATGIPGVTNLVIRYFEDETGTAPNPLPAWVDSKGPRRRPHHEIYYLRQTQDHTWQAAGFFVGQEQTAVGGYRVDPPWPPPIGSLYAYTDPDTIHARRQNLAPGAANEFNTRAVRRFNDMNQRTLLSSRVLDGVVIFRLLPYDAEGRLLDEYSLSRLMGLGVTNGQYQSDIFVGPLTAVALAGNPGASVPTRAVTCLGDQVPATIEIELGVLEPKSAEAYRSVRDAGPAAALAFLDRNQGRIHMFRRRIQLRTVSRSLQP